MVPRYTALVVLFVLVGTVLLSGSAAPQQGLFSETDLLVQFAGLTAVSRKQAILAAVGASSMRRFDQLNAEHARLAPGRSAAQALANLSRFPEVIAAQPDFVRRIDRASAHDPYWLDGSLWGLPPHGAGQTWVTISTGATDVVIAGIDTGVNYFHPDLAANMWRNPNEVPGNGVDDDANGYVDDVYGVDTVNNDADPMDDQ